MIIEEMHSENLVRHYSDIGMKIRQVETSIIYDEAIDVIPCRYTYEETDAPRDDEDATAEEIAKAFGGIL